MFSAVFVAFGLVLPSVFHAVGMAGPVFLPMHIPVFLGGLTLGPAAGLMIGLITPLLSSVLTGMPPLNPPIAFFMMAEMAVYGLLAGHLMKWRGNLWLSLVAAMAGGRVALGLAVAVARLFVAFPGTPVAYVTGSVLSSLPGIALQILVVPALAALLNKTPVGMLAEEARS